MVEYAARFTRPAPGGCGKLILDTCRWFSTSYRALGSWGDRTGTQGFPRTMAARIPPRLLRESW